MEQIEVGDEAKTIVDTKQQLEAWQAEAALVNAKVDSRMLNHSIIA